MLAGLVTLVHGMSSYWMASSTSVDSTNTISVLSVSIHGYIRRLAPDSWENNLALANPATHTANFFVARQGEQDKMSLALKMFGMPVRAYHFESYTIMVWDKNLLPELAPPPAP
jgi:hypothetical protein